MPNLTIKGKLIALALAATLAMLTMGALLNYATDAVGGLQQARLESTRVERDLLMLRRHEKDFLARKQLKYVDRFNKESDHLGADLTALAATLERQGLSAEGIDRLGRLAGEYREQFAALAATVQRVGLNEKSGLLGSLREAVHGAEKVLKALDDDRLMRDMLMLRRNEKDFLARGAMKYLEKFQRNHGVFLASLEETVLDERSKGEITRLMARYRADFEALVAGFQRRGLDPKSGQLGELRATVHRAEQQLGELDRRLTVALAERERAVTTLIASVAIGATIIILLLLAGIARTILRPIDAAVARMNDIARGEGDLTVSLEAQRGDELAALGGAFNTFTGKLRGVIREIAGSGDQLAAVAEESSTVSQHTRGHIAQQRDEISRIAAAIEQMVTTVQAVANSAAEAAEAASAARHEANDGREVAGRAVATVTTLADDVNRAVEVTRRLAEQSHNIGSVLDVIRGIAEQTNLLALNAAIEAARAGEQGRGFAVVADEVRTLASRTQDSTREIQEMIEQLHGGVDEAVKAMSGSADHVDEGVAQIRQADEALKGINEAVARITAMNDQIATAAEEQRGAAEEVGRNISGIRDASEETANGANQTAQAGEQLAQLATEMNQLVTQFKV